jgi:hypothetical protein
MNLSDYTFDELVKLKNEIESHLYSVSDGYLYLCNVRSYGRNWTERPLNTYSLSELCYGYNGDDGIVDVYSTNPDLNIDNYGDVYYIKSEEDYKAWKEWNYLTTQIPYMEKELEEWENRENVPFNIRPRFSPYFTREDIDEYKKQLIEYDMSFVAPVRIYVRNDEDGAS